MNSKVKKSIVVIAATLTATISVGTILSFIPTQEKKLKKSSEIKNLQTKNIDDNIPTLPNKNEQKKQIQKPKNFVKLSNRKNATNLILKEQKINYVALGDSITAGFVATLDKDYPGRFENGKVSGISFPAYLAQSFNKINRLGEFSNFGVSSSEFSEWNLILKSNGDVTALNPVEIKIIEARFGKNWPQMYAELSKKLQRANLVTISLGANDFIHTIAKSIGEFPLAEIVKLINSNDANYELIANTISKLFNDLFTNIQQRQLYFINKIKEMAPKANINFIAFPTPLNTILNMVDRYINNYNDNAKFSISTLLLNLINKKIKFVANSQKTFFINPFDHSYWVQNQKMLTPSLFDIHPGAKGYKKMAQDIFIKLISNNRDQEIFEQNGILWDSEYFQSDQDSYLTQIQVDGEFETIKKVFGNNQHDYIIDNDEQTAQLAAHFNNQNYFNRVLDNIGLEEIIFDRLIVNSFETDIYNYLDPQNLLKNFFLRNNKENLNSLKTWFKNTKLVPNLLKNVEQTFWTKDWDGDNLPGAKINKITYLLEAFKSELSDESKIINLIFSLTQTKVFNQNLEEFKTIVAQVLGNISKLDITKNKISSVVNLFYNEQIAKFISKNDFERLISLTLNSQTFKENIAQIIINIIENNQDFAKNKTFSELWQTLISNNKNQQALKNIIDNLFSDLLKSDEFKQILARSVNRIVISFPKYFEGVQPGKLGNLAVDILNIWNDLNDELQISSKISQNLINELSKNTPNNFYFLTFTQNLVNEFSELFNNENIEKTIVKIIKNVSKINFVEYRETIQIILSNIIKNIDTDSDQFNDILNKIYEIFNLESQNYLSKNDFKSLTQKLIKDESFHNLLNALIFDLTTLDTALLERSETFLDLIKLLFKDLRNLQSLSPALNLIKKTLNYPEFNALFESLKQTYLTNSNADINLVKNLIVEFIDDENLRNLGVNFVQNSLLKNSSSVNKIKDSNYLIKLWLQNNENKEFVFNNAKQLIKKLFKSESFIELVSVLSQNELNKDVQLSEKLTLNEIKTLLNDLSNLTENNEVWNLILQHIVDELATNGTNINILNLSKNVFSVLFENENILNLIKLADSINFLTKNKEVIKKIVFNLTKKTTLVNYLNEKIYNSLPQEFKDLINETDFKQVLNKILTNKKTVQIIDTFVESLHKIPSKNIQSSTNIFDLIKEFIIQVKQTNLFENSTQLLGEIIEYPELNRLLDYVKTLLPNSMNKIELNSLVSLIKNVILYPELKNLIFTFLTQGLLTNDLNSNFDIIELTKNWLLNSQTKNETRQNLQASVTKLIKDQNFIDIISHLAYEYLENNNLTNNLSLEQTKIFVQHLFSDINTLETQIPIIETATQKLIEEFTEYGSSFDYQRWINNTWNSIFNNEQKNNLIVKLSKVILGSNTLKQSKDYLSTLITNLLISSNTNKTIAQAIYQSIPNTEFISNNREQFINLTIKSLQNEELNQLIKVILMNVDEIGSNEIANLNSFLDVVKLLINKFVANNTISNWISLISTISTDQQIIEFLEQNKNNFPPILQNLNFNELAYVLNKTLNNNSFSDIIKNLRDSILTNADNLNKITDINEFVKTWLNNQNNENLKNNIEVLIKNLLDDEQTLNVISSLIYAQLQLNPQLSNNINFDEFKLLVQSLITNLNSYDDENHLFSQIIDVLLNNLANNGVEINIIEILTSSFTSFFENGDKLQNYFNFIKNILKNNVAGKNKNIIKQILKNLLLTNANNNFFIDLIYQPISVEYSNLINKQELITISNLIANDSNFEEFINEFVDNISQLNENELNNSVSIFDLMNKIVNKSNNDSLLNSLISLIKSIIKSSEIDPIINNIKSNWARNFNTLENTTIKNLLINTLDNENFKFIFFDFIKHSLLNSTNSLDTFTQPKLLIQNWLDSEQKITQISSKFNNFIEQLLKNNDFKQLASKLLTSWLNHYQNNVTLEQSLNFIETILASFNLINDNSHISQALTEHFLTHLTKNKIKVQPLELIKELASIFENDNTNTLNRVVVKIFKNNQISAHREIVKAIIKSSFKTISNNDIAKNIYTAFSPLIGEYISENNFANLLVNISNNDKLDAFVNALVNDLANVDVSNLEENATLFDIAKSIFKNIENYSSFTPLLAYISEIIASNELDKTYEVLLAKLPTEFTGIAVSDFKSFLQFILKNDEIQDLIKSLIKNGLFADSIDKNSIKNINEVIKQWLSEQSNKTNIQQNLKSLILKITKEDSFINMISRVLFNTMLNNSPLAQNIDFEQIKNLTTALLTNLELWDNNTDFINKILTILIENIAQNGLKLNYQNVLNQITNSIFDLQNIENSLINLVKTTSQLNIITEHKEVLKTLISNIIKYLPNKLNVAKSIYDSLPQRILDSIQGQISAQNFENVINDTLKNSANEINELLATFLDLSENNQQIANINSFAQLINILLNNKDNRLKISNYIEAIFTNLLAHQDMFEFLNTLWKQNLIKYDVDVENPANIKFVQDLFKELPTLIKQLKLVPKIIDGIYNSSQNDVSTEQMLQKMLSEILKSLNLSDYSILKIILQSNTLINNKEILKIDILKIVEKITSDDNLIENFVNDFNLLQPLINLGIEHQEALSTFKETLKSSELKSVLDTFLNEIFDNNTQYAQLDNWSSAIAKFFNSTNAQNLKTPLKNWIKNLFTNHEKIGLALGKFLAKTMQENGITIPQDEVIKVAKFIQEFTRESAKTQIVDDVVEEVFNTLKSIANKQPSEIPQLLQKAFTKGALKFISSDDGTIMLGKIFEKKDIFKQILNGINSKSYVDFINLIFKYSPRSFSEGIYGIMFAPKNQSSSVKFNASSGIGGIIRGELSSFIKIFIQPFVKQYYEDLSKTNAYTSINDMKQNSQAFQAMWRFYAFISRILYENTPSGLFWNATNLTTEAYIMNAYTAAINEEAPKYWNNNLKTKYISHPDWIGLDRNGKAINYFVSGLQELTYGFSKYHSRDNGLRDYFYGRDYTLAYIYWGNNNDQKYNNGKKKRETLLNDMIIGYQPVDTK
ncbi:SGNH/GDSL hydrolase family protein [Mycoplasmopsis phocirhinis]|uniref:SGNH/GDSL hydrolase family protein n=1 Tax=Mycoplasmopsis phocirhinis TaxID=142650 RepID=A0A4P6MRM4_9BACT|nr:SGNH/GDSL hydrolase family protein [Mycoplasmopsis phocirhinis]QBF34481.1 SGNH/GDSL hydrolase family protein [Mycoplasmopsis phocirhinis]